MDLFGILMILLTGLFAGALMTASAGIYLEKVFNRETEIEKLKLQNAIDYVIANVDLDPKDARVITTIIT